MSDENTREVTLQARLVPGDNGGPFKTMQEANAAGHDTLTPVTGTYRVGVVDQGAFIPFFEAAASDVLAAVERAKEAAGEAPPEPPAAA